MLVIDISEYQKYMSEQQWDLLSTILDGVIIRIVYGTTFDSNAANAIKHCVDRGLPWTAYGWVDPTKNMISQQIKFRQAVDIYKPPSIFNDYEQYWSDWAAYMRQDLVEAKRTKFTPTQIDTYYRTFQSWGETTLGIPIGKYSADWFIDEFCTPMKTWVKTDNYWEARYLRYYDAAWYTMKKLLWGNPYDISRVKELAAHATIFSGIGRQFESLLTIYGLNSGIQYRLDWNVFTDKGYKTMFQVGNVQPPPVPIPQTNSFIVNETCWVREIPEGRKIGYKNTGNIVVVTETNIVNGTTWSHILPNGWIASRLLSPYSGD